MDNAAVNPKKIKEGFIGQKMVVLPPNIKRSVLKNELIKRFYLTAVGYYPHASYHDRERRAGSGQYILLYCVSGKGSIYLAGKTISLLPNTYFIIPKNVPHRYTSSETDPWSIYWVHFAGEHADLLYNRQVEKDDRISIPHNERLITLFNEILALLDNSFNMPDLEIVNIKLQHFVASFIYQDASEHTPALADPVSNSILFMKANLDKNYGIDELAKQQHLSVSHYCRLFRQKTGASPNQYFNQLKIQKSCQYLYFTDMHVKEICAVVGFDDPFYFSRSFKKMMGVSPSDYKKQHKQ
jgi:AraC-like DNA-binding protein